MPRTCGHSSRRRLGRSVLASQFSAGSLPEIKVKVAGSEGDMDALLAKARLEEAKVRDLAVRPKKTPPNFLFQKPAKELEAKVPKSPSGAASGEKTMVLCYGCGAYGHYRNKCPGKGKGKPMETPGKDQSGKSGRSQCLQSIERVMMV